MAPPAVRQYLALRPVRIRLDIASGNWGTLWEGRCRTYRSSLQETRQLDLGKHCPIASHLLLKLFPRPSLHGSCRLLCCRLVRSVSRLARKLGSVTPVRATVGFAVAVPPIHFFFQVVQRSWLLVQWWLGFPLLRWLLAWCVAAIGAPEFELSLSANLQCSSHVVFPFFFSLA